MSSRLHKDLIPKQFDIRLIKQFGNQVDDFLLFCDGEKALMDGGGEVDFAQFVQRAGCLHFAACHRRFFLQDGNPFDVSRNFDAAIGYIFGQLLELCQFLCIKQGGVGQEAVPPKICLLLRRQNHLFLRATVASGSCSVKDLAPVAKAATGVSVQAHARVESIPKAVADEVDGQHADGNHQAGRDPEPEHVLDNLDISGFV